MNPRMPKGRQASGSPNYTEARRHAGDLAWALGQIDVHGRYLGPVDLHDLAQATAGELSWAVGITSVPEPSLGLPITLAGAVDALGVVLVLAEGGDQGGETVARSLAGLIVARTARLGIAAGPALDGAVLPLDGRASMAQRCQVVPDQMVGARR